MHENWWLMKSEPDVYPWSQLMADGETDWDGVRNHQAAAALRAMRVGDRAFFYHSGGAREIVGLMRVISPARPDPTDETGKFVCVRVAPVVPLPKPVGLSVLKANPFYATLPLIRQSRLSVMAIPSAMAAQILHTAGIEDIRQVS